MIRRVQQLALLAFLIGGFFLPLTQAYAEAGYAEAIRRARSKSGDQIYGLDNMISPTAPRAAQAIQDAREQEVGEQVFSNSYDTQKLNEEAKRLLLKEKAESQEERTVIPTVALSIPMPGAMRATRPVPVADSIPGLQFNTGRPSTLAPMVPTDRVEPQPERSTYAKNTEEGEEQDQVQRRTITPLFDPGPKRVVRNELPPAPQPQAARWTEPHSIQIPSPATPDSNSGFWDELNAARENARMAVSQSWNIEDSNRLAPVNLPDGKPRQLSAGLRNELDQASSAAAAIKRQLNPQQASVGGVRSVGDDAIADELREVERDLGAGTEKLLTNIQRSETPNGELSGYGGDDVPMLRPKRIARRRGTRDRDAIAASALSRNYYARGSAKGDSRREPQNTNFQVTQYRGMENFYRHIKPDALPSKPRGSNVRYHSSGTPDDGE